VTNLDVEVHTSSELHDSIASGIITCAEVMVPVIFGTVKHPITSDDITVSFDESTSFKEEELDKQGGRTMVQVVITLFKTKRLVKQRKQLTMQMVAALEEVLSSNFAIYVTLSLIADAYTADNYSREIPDITTDPKLAAALDIVAGRICYDSEIIPIDDKLAMAS
jgi:hypothetical protein